MRTAILLIALCRLLPLKASWGRRPPVSLSWAQAGGSRKTGLSPLSSPSFLGPVSQVEAAVGMGHAGLGCPRLGRKAAEAYTAPCLIQSSQIPNLMGPWTRRPLESCLPQLGKRAKEVRCQSC